LGAQLAVVPPHPHAIKANTTILAAATTIAPPISGFLFCFFFFFFLDKQILKANS
jgi:hypothetical protein